jgi:hypothetical protein
VDYFPRTPGRRRRRRRSSCHREPQVPPSDRHAAYPLLGLRLRNVHPGVEFVLINLSVGARRVTGRFVSDPYTIPRRQHRDDTARVLRVAFITSDGQRHELDPAEMGIAPYGRRGEPYWNGQSVTVRPHLADQVQQCRMPRLRG